MKKFLSVILAALILVCPLSGFATDVAEQTLEWNFCEDDDYCDTWVYSYKGEIALGETEITFTEDDFCDYYTFNAENAGYYYIECLYHQIEWLGFPKEIKDGKAHLIAENAYTSGSYNEVKCVYKLDAGETVLGVDFNGRTHPSDTYNVKIEYLGNAITDISLEEGVLDNLVLNVDLFNTDASYIITDVDAVFSDGKTISFPENELLISAETHEWVKGENKATTNFFGFEKNIVVSACEMTDLVTDVEFVNLDEFKNVSSSFNNFDCEYLYGAELVFTLANGEKISLNTDESDYIEINNRGYYAYAFYDFIDDETAEIVVTINGEIVKTFSCNVIKTTLAEGSKELIFDISENLKDSFYYSRVALSELLRMYDASDFEDTLSDVSYYFERSIDNFFGCFTLIRLFLSYYF